MVWLKRSLGTNPDNRSGITSSLRNTGMVAQQVDFREFNELFFKSQIEHAWGTQGQVTANEATFYVDALGVPKDKTGATVTLGNDSRIAMVHDVAATADILFNPASGKRFLIQSEVGLDISMGDAGGGIPYKLIFGPNVDGCDMMVNMSQRFEDIPFASTDAEKRFVANQGIRNRIQVNEDMIYDPANVGNIVTKDSYPTNPYLVRMNGQQLPWSTHASVLTSAWFRDLNKALQGYRDGSETQSRFTLPAVIGANPHLFQVNTPNGMLRDISTVDPDIHARTDSNGVSIAATVDFDGSSTVLFQGSIGNAKNFMRISGGAIPGGSTATTILTDIDETAKTATMVDALTLSPISVGSATGVAATIDNSGAAGGSLQTDAMYGHHHDQYYNSAINVSAGGTAWAGIRVDGVTNNSLSASTTDSIRSPKTDGVNGTPKTGPENRPNTTDIFFFYQG